MLVSETTQCIAFKKKYIVDVVLSDICMHALCNANVSQRLFTQQWIKCNTNAIQNKHEQHNTPHHNTTKHNTTKHDVPHEINEQRQYVHAKSHGNEWIQHNTNALQRKTNNTTHHNTTHQNTTHQNTTECKKLISNDTTFLQDRPTKELFKLESNMMYSDMHAKPIQLN